MNKNQELEELSNTLLQIYIKNINFFSKSFPILHKKVVEFEKLAIENYSIEFENNHFELKAKNGKNIYNCDPFFDAQSRCKNLEDKPSFELIKNEIFEEAEFYENEINAKEYINEYLINPSDSKTFSKFIFIGTLLGVHLNDLDKVLNSKIYLIIENNLEIFRLSMFLTDYESLAKNSKLFFCIEENQESKEKILKEFLNFKTEFNNKIAFELANEFNIDNIEIITQTFIDQDPLNYPFSEYLVSLKRNLKYFKQYENSFLELKTKQNIINKPVLFLGAGPSLAKSIEWIYMNQDNFLIVCAGSTLKKLQLLDIVPDIILNVDGQKEQVLKQFDIYEKFYKNSIIITSIKTDEEIIGKVHNKNHFFFSDNLEVISNCGTFTGVTVGDVGLQLLLKLGSKELFLLGFDAAVSKEGKTHVGTHYTRSVEGKKADIISNSGLNTENDLLEVKGNFREKVLTFILYTQMIDSINSITSSLDSSIKLYNLSDGAFFEGITPLKKENIDFENLSFIEKNKEKELLSSSLKEICICKMSQKDLSYIKLENKVLKKLNNLNEKTYINLFEKQKKQYKNSIVIQILDRFFKLTNPYKQQIKDGQKIQFEQFKKICDSLKTIL